VDEELCLIPATELAGRYRRRELSPVEVTAAILDRIVALNDRFRAFITITDDFALAQAKAAEDAYLEGKVGPLTGIPISIKDLSPTKGIRTTRGSLLYEDWIPDFDSIFVERVRAAGAVFLGKTNTPEYGWKGESTNRLIGSSQNPWKIGRTPGGSSGGGAAAVAAGLGPIAQGSDGAGSIRIPCGFCGIFGFKPSHGFVPHFPPSSVGDVAHVGPMTRTVADAALLLSVVSGPDARDRYSWADNLDFTGVIKRPSVDGLRVAWSADLGYAPVEPEVAAIAAAAVENLRSLGATVVDAHPALSDPWPIVDTIWCAGMAALHRDNLDEVRGLIDPERLPIIERGFELSALELAANDGARLDYYQSWIDFMKDFDLFVSPTLPCTAFEAGSSFPASIDGRSMTYLSWTAFTYPFNLTGMPAATVPVGFDSEGLPVGLQLVGRWRDDATVLKAAAALEAAMPWAGKWPPIRPAM
jgi:aspartyl-tRNA(Asn)/glutamyl-tRNA(Gln) amidotransferase subunit A